MTLYFRESGQGEPLVFIHGIFGSSDNWMTQTKMLSDRYHTYAVDMRNHGHSPHADEFDYKVMTKDVLEFIDTHDIKNPVLIGHSMGGKIAMNFAVAHPEKLSRLIVVDIAPKAYDLSHYAILDALNALSVEEITSRNDADEALTRYIAEPDVRQFLLKNLQRRKEGGFKWKLNLPAITRHIGNIGLDMQFEGTFGKPVLFVRGSRSGYVAEGDINRIREVFPKAEMETMDTGHWLPAEKPEEFVRLIDAWLQK